jgi:RHS repeat-associated protein
MSYTATDQLGSPRVITNSLGEVVSRRDFMPFGEELYNNIGERTTNLKYGTIDSVRQKFTGYLKDDETGLDFAEARMYENRHARFTAVDPLLASGKSANPQTFNRFVYVMNNPLAYTDPTGLQVGTNNEPCNTSPTCGNSSVNAARDTITPDSTIATVFSNDVRLLGIRLFDGDALQSALSYFAYVNGTDDGSNGSPFNFANGLVNETTRPSIRQFIQSMSSLEWLAGNVPVYGGMVRTSMAGIRADNGTGSYWNFGFEGAMLGVDIATLPTGGSAKRQPGKEALEIGGETAGNMFYHGTDIVSANKLLQGEGLNAAKAAASKMDGPPGFFLASSASDAEFFAARRAGGILQYEFSNRAMQTLTSCGMICQPIPAGRTSKFLGNELIVPTGAFDTFNSLRRAGEIIVSPR